MLYWTKRHTPNRGESGRWHGPARVIIQEGSSIVWLSHGDRLIRRAPESVRPASLREWNSWNEVMPQALVDVSQIPVPATPRYDDIPDIEYSPTTAPESPQPYDPDNSQPEQEASHPPTIDADSGQSTPTAHSDVPNSEAETEANVEDSHLLQMVNLTQCEESTNNATSNIPCEDALHVFDTYIPAEQSNPSETICLAEDGTPYIDQPIECNVEECYSVEIPMKAEDLLAWSLETILKRCPMLLRQAKEPV